MTKDKSIFIKNIYYMLSYAFTTLQQSDDDKIATEEFENMHNLFAAILSKGIGRQLKQGLYREYMNRKEDLPVMRGKIDMPGTIKNKIEKKQRLTCEFDELSENNLLNQILKTTVIFDAKNELYECIRFGTKEEFLEIAERLRWCTKSEKDLRRINEAASYIASNWTAAKYRLRKSDGVVGCSAEGHVYHVLSSRMSTLAMGWSRHGGSQMAHLREYYCNGGDMLELAKYQKVELPMAAGAEEVVLSASEMLRSEHTNRTKTVVEYGKYAETMRASMSTQTSRTTFLHYNHVANVNLMSKLP